MVGGLCTSAALSLEAPGRAEELMLFCVARALDVVFRWCVAAGAARPLPRGEAAVFVAAVATLLAVDRSALRPATRRAVDFVFGPAAEGPGDQKTASGCNGGDRNARAATGAGPGATTGTEVHARRAVCPVRA
jgi:hypothetical protein